MLSPEDYRDHLTRTSARAGFSFDELVLPADCTAKIRGMSFHYLDWGGPSKNNGGERSIVFLHGAALNAHTWDLCSLALRPHYHCYALDQRGHGDTDWSPDVDYSIASQRDDAIAFVEHLGLKKFILVGMSMGAMNALAYAGARPETLDALVLIDSTPDMRRNQGGAQRIRDFVDHAAEFPSLEAVIEHALNFNPRRDPVLLRRSLLHNMRQNEAGNWIWKYDRRRFQGMSDPARLQERLSLWDGVPRVTCPTLVVKGAESDLFSAEDAEKLTRSFATADQVTIARAGHTVQGDNPKDLVSALEGFFAKHGLR